MTWQPKSSLTVETSHWTSSDMDSVPLLSSSRLWDLDFQIKCKMYFHLKRGWCLIVVTLETLTLASVHSLWRSPKCLNWLWLTVFSSLQSSLLRVHISLPNFFLPVNFAFNMLWYSTPWTATPFSNDPLWLTLFVEGVNDHLLDHCQVSSVPHYCRFKEQEIQNWYCMDGNLLKLKCNYSNILRYWFFDFH